MKIKTMCLFYNRKQDMKKEVKKIRSQKGCNYNIKVRKAVHLFFLNIFQGSLRVNSKITFRNRMLIKHLPPKPGKRIPPVPSFKQKMFSQKNIDPEAGQLVGLAKDMHSKKDLHRNGSFKSLSSNRKYRPTSASSLKTRGSSKDSALSSQAKAKEGILKNPPKLTSFNWGIFQINSGLYLGGLRADKRRQFASLTKIMNLVTILNLIDQFEFSPSEIWVRVTETASKINGTSAELKKGQELTLENLFYAMMLPSGNDAAYQIAQVGGAILKLCRGEKRKKQLVYSVAFLRKQIEGQGRANVIRYLAEMNRLSKQLGLCKSKWSNPHGLSNRQNFSTINDLALLCTHAMKKEEFRKVVNAKQYSCVVKFEIDEDKENINDNQEGRQGDKMVRWVNTNKMLWKGWNGVKTGITPNAGPCLAATLNKTIQKREYQFLVILGGCESMQQRWDEVSDLVDWTIGLHKEWETLINC